eukprot:TRINITY_DN9040_c0_g1_i1.p1 TRINITY_DN9040_c0_g1~~TRINITY_DN9040_c0_g1_i1.p1  ORF type:complete len:1267 (-),score=259.51 TRINITY_DN9040_c0_g1_i1:9-3788(-)
MASEGRRLTDSPHFNLFPDFFDAQGVIGDFGYLNLNPNDSFEIESSGDNGDVKRSVYGYDSYRKGYSMYSSYDREEQKIRKMNYAVNYTGVSYSQFTGSDSMVYGGGFSFSETHSSSVSTDSSGDSDSYVDKVQDMDKRNLLDVCISMLEVFGVSKFSTLLVSHEITALEIEELRTTFMEIFRRMSEEVDVYKQALDDFQDMIGVDKIKDFDTYHWTNRFENYIGDTQSTVALEKDFNSTVETLSRTIILEKNTPNYLKSIKLVNVGGIAGGDKYIVHGILFKFASDKEIYPGTWLYGGHQRNDFDASKALNNDISALRALYSLQKPESCIRIPLMSTYSYLGSVLCAVSLLPIEGIVYGTANAGKTIYSEPEDMKLMEELEAIRGKFNLRPHWVSDGEKVLHKMIFAADVEIHRSSSKEDSYYLLDLGRFFPTNNPQKPFVHLFRPEALESVDYPKGISADCYSGFGRVDATELNEDLREYIKIFMLSAVDNFFKEAELILYGDREYLPSKMHTLGLNIRHLGHIRHELHQKYLNEPFFVPMDKLLLSEIVLRSLKSLFSVNLNEISRMQIIPNETMYKEKIIDIYTSFKEDSENWSSLPIKQMIYHKFGSIALTEEEIEGSVLSIFTTDEKIQIYKDIPHYCNFTGGILPSTTTIQGVVKSCIPKVNDENYFNELLRSTETNQEDYYKLHVIVFRADLSCSLIREYLFGFFKHITETHYVKQFSLTFFKKFPYFSSLLDEDEMNNLCRLIWRNKSQSYSVRVIMYCFFRKYHREFLKDKTYKIDSVTSLYNSIFKNGHLDLYNEYSNVAEEVIHVLVFFSDILNNITILCSDLQLSTLGSLDSSVIDTVSLVESNWSSLLLSRFRNNKTMILEGEFQQRKLSKFKKLRELQVRNSPVDFVDSLPKFKNLSSLILENVDAVSDSIWSLIRNNTVENLELKGCTNVGRFTTFNPSHLQKVGKNLTRLDISDTGFSNHTLFVLELFCNLKHLIAHIPDLNDDGIRNIVRSKKLENLDVESENGFTSYSLFLLHELKKLKFLRIIGLELTVFSLSIIDKMNLSKLVVGEVPEKLLPYLQVMKNRCEINCADMIGDIMVPSSKIKIMEKALHDGVYPETRSDIETNYQISNFIKRRSEVKRVHVPILSDEHSEMVIDFLGALFEGMKYINGKYTVAVDNLYGKWNVQIQLTNMKDTNSKHNYVLVYGNESQKRNLEPLAKKVIGIYLVQKKTLSIPDEEEIQTNINLEASFSLIRDKIIGTV